MANTFKGFLFVDVETTGLIPSEGMILELGMGLYTPDLEMVDVFHNLVVNPEFRSFYKNWANKPDYVFEMHHKSGLIDDIIGVIDYEQGELDPKNVSDRAVEWLADHNAIDHNGMKPTRMMCGSSVHFDKQWLAHHMPALHDRFHYRIIDVSAIAEYGNVVAPELTMNAKKEAKAKGEHRVLPDIMDSIAYLKAMRSAGIIIS